MLPEIFDHQDQNVRASSKGLTLELCRWIGRDPVKFTLFEKLRDTMKKELEAKVVNVTGSAKPTCKIRSEKDKEPQQEVEAEASGTGPSEESATESICERVADIKTRAQAMKCLTTFSEVVGSGFIFEGMFKIMKEHKNPKVLSEGLLWMVSAVAHLKLKDVIDFCCLQSSAAVGALHKYVGPDIKAFLSDVKHALLSAVEAGREKNPFEGAAAAPKKMVKATYSVSSVSGGGVDSLPHEDIRGKIMPALLKRLESSDWKIRLAVNKIVEEANKRIQPTGTGTIYCCFLD